MVEIVIKKGYKDKVSAPFTNDDGEGHVLKTLLWQRKKVGHKTIENKLTHNEVDIRLTKVSWKIPLGYDAIT